MVTTNASAVIGPTPGCVLNSCAILSLSRFFFRRLVQLANPLIETLQQPQQVLTPPCGPALEYGNSRNAFCPAALHSLPFFCIPRCHRQVLQPVLHPRPDLHQLVAMQCSNCRTSRCSALAVPQLRKPPFSTSSRRMCAASRLSVFCFCARSWPGSAPHLRSIPRCPNCCNKSTNHSTVAARLLLPPAPALRQRCDRTCIRLTVPVHQLALPPVCSCFGAPPRRLSQLRCLISRLPRRNRVHACHLASACQLALKAYRRVQPRHLLPVG